MAHGLFAVFGVVVLFGCGSESDAPIDAELRWLEARVRFADASEANAVLGMEDEFVAALSGFDRSLRLKTFDPISREEFLAHAEQQGRSWTEPARRRWTDASMLLSRALEGLALSLPEEIVFARSSGEEDLGAPYTRGAAIVIPERGDALIDRYQVSAHELFHVATRHDPQLRTRLYPLIGFTYFEALPFPESLEGRRLTNPDAPHLDASVRVNLEERSVDVVPMLQANADLPEVLALRSPLSALTTTLLEFDSENQRLVTDAAGAVESIAVADTDYEGVASVNTGYIIHAEEILADNFALLMMRRADLQIEIERPEVLDRIEAELSR